ncbi:MAG TPA: YfhO family protein [Bryobacteraceae bacterium]|nr:YfhO family protein [Bryobacteraceae bacterium]
MTRSTAKYLGLLALAITLFYWKILLTDQYTMIIGEEGFNMTYAWLHFWVRSIWQGHIPLWDPYAFGGRPFAGEMLPSAFYPLHLLFALAPMNRNGMVSPRFFHEFLTLTHLLGACFMFALLRELGRSRPAAFIGACAFSLSGLLASMIWPPYVESGIWLPVIFLFLLRAFKARTRAKSLMEAALAGGCLGMSILTGGMNFFIMQAIVVISAVFYFGAVSRPVPASDQRSHWSGMLLVLAAALVVGGGIGAIQLLPGNEYSHLTMRYIDGGAFPSSQKIPYDRLVPGVWPQSLASGLFPFAFGGKYGGEEYFPYYVGILPLFLAVIGIWRHWNNLWVRYLTGLAVLSFVYALGELSPLHGVLYAVVPLLWAARAANRFFYLVTFALAILAAFGLDTLLEGTGEPWWAPAKRVLKWAAIAAAAAFLVPAVFNKPDLNLWNAFSLLLILASCGLLMHLIRQPAGPWIRAGLAVFVLFDIGAFHWTEADKTSPSTKNQMDRVISLRGPVEFIKSRPGLHRVRVDAPPEPNIGDVYGVQGIFGGGGTVLTEYSRLVPLDVLLNVRYHIKPASATDPSPVYSDGQWKVFEDPKAFPRAWIVHKTIVEPNLDKLYTSLYDPALDLHHTALLEARLPEAPEPGSETGESIRFRSYEPDHMSIAVNVESAGLLVLSELYYPGWRATVNGKPAAIYRADGALRGIWAPRGQDRIELYYEPMSFYVGATITLLTLLCVAVGFALSRRKSKAGADLPLPVSQPAWR